MTGVTIDLSGFTDVVDDLRGAPDHLAFMFGEPDGDTHVRADKRLPLDTEHIDDRGWHVELTDAGKQYVLEHATHTPRWIIEAHSHGRLGDPVRFSPTDHDGLKLWVPHLAWRLSGRGYVALVLGHDTIDGLAWLPGGAEPIAIEHVRISATQTWPATGRSLADWNRRRQ
jgi:hypothetical protein